MVTVDAGRGSQARRRMQSQKVVRKIKWACHAKVRIDKKQRDAPKGTGATVNALCLPLRSPAKGSDGLASLHHLSFVSRLRPCQIW